MTPVNFPEANVQFGPPPELTDAQCKTISAYLGAAQGGSVDGCKIVVTAWQPTPQEMELIAQGKPIFLSCIGSLPPHFLSLDFHSATHPA